MTAKQILELIEAVDPSDESKLAEIDQRVWCYLQKKEYCGITVSGFYFRYKGENQYEISVSRHEAKPVTRSRDALKKIRPEEWSFWAGGNECFFKTKKYVDETGNNLEMKVNGATEELAELYAIIMAIEFERNK